jgi:hypothetical protein
MFCRPARHCLQAQQGRNGSIVTRAPTGSDTPAPTASTVPLTS